MKRVLYFSLIVIPLLLTACKSKQSASVEPIKNLDTINFEQSETLSAVLDKAAKTEKLVFVDFYTPWCLPCKIMDESVYTNKEVAKLMNDNFINYKVNGEEGNGVNLITIFGVQYYPTVLFLDTKGRVIERKEGSIMKNDFTAMAERVLECGDSLTMTE